MMFLSRPYLHALRIAVAVLFWPVLASVVWGQLTVAENLSLLHGINDKLLHFFSYFTMAGMVALSRKSRAAAVLSVLGLIVLGGVLEVLQGLVGRDMSVYDEVANAAGAILGGTLARMVIEPLRRRFAGG